MKKILVTICAVSVSAMLAAASVYASADSVRPQPGTETDSAYTTSAGDQAVTDTAADTAAAGTAGAAVTNTNTTANNVTANTAANNTNKKYQSRLGGFLWFLLSVIVNFVISCWVGNRFYKLAKRSAQGSSEIRALRKDIEEKFASTLKDISEPAVEVINQNESYARTDEGIAMPERRGHIELNEEEREMMRKWDARRASARASEEIDEPEDDDYYEDEPAERAERRLPRSYQPTRRSSGIDFEDDEEIDAYDDDEEYEYEERRSVKSRPSRTSERRASVKRTAKKTSSKAKKFLDNVFPFDE
ncbi:MAG: hypothetical protein ACI38A_11055 [Candidatus Ornithomonoglobus sp.]